jgi:hypothetical protein
MERIGERKRQWRSILARTFSIHHFHVAEFGCPSGGGKMLLVEQKIFKNELVHGPGHFPLDPEMRNAILKQFY